MDGCLCFVSLFIFLSSSSIWVVVIFLIGCSSSWHLLQYLLDDHLLQYDWLYLLDLCFCSFFLNRHECFVFYRFFFFWVFDRMIGFIVYLDYFFLEVLCCMLLSCFSHCFFLLSNYITFNLYSCVLRKALTHVYHPLDLFNSLLITNRFSWIYGIGLRQSQVFLVAKFNLWSCVRKTKSWHNF